jgi:DNA processing protein
MKDEDLLNLIRVAKSSTLSRLLKSGFSLSKVISYSNSLENSSGKKILPSKEKAEIELENCKKIGVSIISIEDEIYPSDLKKIQNPPVLLYAKGNLNLLKKEKFAIVGARVASVESRQIAENFAKSLSDFGFTITSGFAFGVDTASCIGSLKSGTIQVLGSGINVIYPKENTSLYYKVIENQGLFISEVPPNCPAKPENFPSRNRIIVGISKGVLLVQASKKNGSSGSLITARITLEQEKELFAIPGHPLDSRFDGGNDLIKHGNAIFTTTPDDIISMIGYYVNKKEKITTFKPKNIKLLDEEKEDIELIVSTDLKEKILANLGTNAIHIDEIASLMEENLQAVQIAVSELELLSKLQRHRDGRFSLNLC